MRTGNRHNCAELLTQVADGGERDFHRQPRVGHANSLETSAQPKTFPKRRLFRGGEVIRETQSDNTAVAVGRVLPDVGKVQIACEQRISGLTDTLRNRASRAAPKPMSIANSTWCPCTSSAPIADLGILASIMKRMQDYTAGSG